MTNEGLTIWPRLLPATVSTIERRLGEGIESFPATMPCSRGGLLARTNMTNAKKGQARKQRGILFARLFYLHTPRQRPGMLTFGPRTIPDFEGGGSHHVDRLLGLYQMGSPTLLNCKLHA